MPASSARWVSVTERVDSAHGLAGFSPKARQPSSLKSQRRSRPPARCGAQAFKRTRRKASASSCSAVSMGMPQSRFAVCEWHVAFPSRADVSGRLSNRINFYQIQDQQTDRVVPRSHNFVMRTVLAMGRLSSLAMTIHFSASARARAPGEVNRLPWNLGVSENPLRQTMMLSSPREAIGGSNGPS